LVGGKPPKGKEKFRFLGGKKKSQGEVKLSQEKKERCFLRKIYQRAEEGNKSQGTAANCH